MMKAKKLIAAAAALGVLFATAAVTAWADNLKKPTATCPNCGTEFEIETPVNHGGDKGFAPASLEEIKAALAEKVAAGELTQEEADAKTAEIEARQAEMAEKQAARQAEIAEKIASGELTQEEANAAHGRFGKEAGGMGRRGGHGMPSDDSVQAQD